MDPWVVTLVERAAFLRERGGPAFSRTLPNAQAADRLSLWRRRVAPGVPVRFARRLAWEGWTPEEAEARCSGVRWRGGEALPAWSTVIGEAVRQVEKGELVTSEAPFGELLLPILRAARPLPPHHELLTFPLMTENTWEWYALRRLVDLAGPALQEEFTAFRVVRMGFLAAGEDGGPRLYRAFLDRMRQGHWRAFLGERATLARWLATAALDDAATLAALRQHAQEDHPSLAPTLLNQRDADMAMDAEPGLSDPHEGGRTVWSVAFLDGGSAAYKPRPLMAELAWQGLLTWLNERLARDAGPQLLALPVLDGGNHGWMSWAAHRACATKTEVDLYYHRAGLLLALAYALGASDLHRENVVAHGEHPVLVDLETVMQPRWRTPPGEEDDDPVRGRARWFYGETVLRTGLLPVRMGTHDEAEPDVSGLRSAEPENLVRTEAVWRHVNTGAMALEREPQPYAAGAHEVWLDKERVSPALHVWALITGFRRMCRLLRQERAALLAEDGPLAAFRVAPLRVLYRPTHAYEEPLRRARGLAGQRDGAEASIELETLAAPLLHTDEAHPHWPLIVAEQEALLRGDVPLFRVAANATELTVGEAKVACFAESAWDRARSQLARLDTADEERQVSYLRATYARQPAVTPYVMEEGIDAARRIGEAIAGATIVGPHGHTSWFGVAHGENGRWQRQPLGPDLYDGLTGTALFLAALAKSTGEARWRDLAGSALKEAVAEAATLATAGGLGSGIASVVFGLVRAGTLLADARWWDEAAGMVDRLLPSPFAACLDASLLTGTAGQLLAILALHAVRPEERLRAAALHCGDLLLDARQQGPYGHLAWPGPTGRLEVGMATGASGPVLALLRLHALDKETRWREAAIGGLAFEADFVAADGTWRFPSRSGPHPGRPAEAGSWCRGTAGLALVRAEAWQMWGDEMAHQQVRDAVHHAINEPLEERDTLCCGTAGRMELLLRAAQWGDRKLVREAEDVARLVVERAVAAHSYGIPGQRQDAAAPLFTGAAGIGYQLLRVAAPGVVPSVLP